MFNLNFYFLPKYPTKSESNNFEVFMAKHLRPDWGSMAGSLVRCRADHLVDPDPKVAGFDHIWNIKGMWPGHVICLHCIVDQF